jgi:4-amino-4-deoxy-L-arabinose transferase-like glycosyltransferase
MESILNKLSARPQRSIICLGLLLMLSGNWILPLTDRDEARFSEASREMIQRSDYIVPWFNGEWRLYKPTGIYWCQIASYRVLGVNEFAARLPSALFTTATALLLVRWGRKIADAKTGFLAGAMLLTGVHLAVFGRAATADLALIFFFTLATWSGWELTRPEQSSRRKWWWIFYLALVLGFLAKGPVAWLPLVGMILGRALRRDSFRLPLTETVVGLAVAVALIGCWGIPALVQTNGMFWTVGMNEQVYQRAVAVNNGHGLAGIWGFFLPLPFYFVLFFVSFFPWSTRVPMTLYRWWREPRRDDLGWYLLTIAATVFIVFSLVKTKLFHYTMPAFPLIALWLARQISGAADLPGWFGKRFMAVAVLILALTLVGSSIIRGHLLTLNLWKATQSYVKPETKIGCFGYTEPSLVWKFRSVATNYIVLGDEKLAKNFLTNTPPFILVLPTKDLAGLPDPGGLQIAVHGLDMVRFKNWNLTAIVKE